MEKKFFTLIVGLCLILWASNILFAATNVIKGTMTSAVDGDEMYIVDIQDTGGGIAQLDQYTCTYPDYTLTPLTQEIGGFTREYSRTPDNTQILTDEDGNEYVLTTWNNLTTGVITTTCTFAGTLTNDLFGLKDSTPFPIPQGTPLPDRYLEATESTQSDHPEIIALADSLTGDVTLVRVAVRLIEDWIIDNITWQAGLPSDALSVFYNRAGNCGGFAHLAVALMRAVGVPARYISGGSIQHQYEIPGPEGSSYYIDWGQGTHAWIEVYYPGAGWIPYEPQLFYHYQHTHAFKVGVGRDRSDVSDGKWQWSYYPPAPAIEISKVVGSTITSDSINFHHVDTLVTPRNFAVADSLVADTCECSKKNAYVIQVRDLGDGWRERMGNYLKNTVNQCVKNYKEAGYDVIVKENAGRPEIQAAIQDPGIKALTIISHGPEDAPVEWISDGNDGILDSDVKRWIRDKFGVETHPCLKEVTLHSCGNKKQSWEDVFGCAPYSWRWYANVIAVYWWEKLVHCPVAPKDPLHTKRLITQYHLISDFPVSNVEDDQMTPVIAFDGSNYLVVWVDGRNSDTANVVADIYGTRLTSEGTLLDPAGIGISQAASDQIFPSIAFDGTNYLVVWTDYRDSLIMQADIYGARVTTEGILLDPAGIGISQAASDQMFPSVAFDGTNYLVVWTDYRNADTTEVDIYGARINQDGEVLDPAGVGISRVENAQGGTSIAFDGANYLVVWADGRDQAVSGVDIYGARVTPGGVVLDSAGIGISQAASDQMVPSVAFNDTNYLVVWTDYRNDSTTGPDIYGARIKQDGEVLDPAGVGISETGNTQWAPTIACNDTNYLVVWTDARNYISNIEEGIFINLDIYGSMITSLGYPGEERPLLPRTFSLAQNYPNPFNSVTEIKYTLPRDCYVKCTIYNILGQRVASLVDGHQKTGYKTARWDARSFSSGIYFYRLQAGDFVQTRKMVLLK